ncbi:MAG: hypothetical protein CMJ32_04495 [Phycisphaerae bacterium]|nr:hypothetical protein [Phycisphaerae bacterium]
MNDATSRSVESLDRRAFLGAAAVSSLALALPRISAASTQALAKPVRLGVISDLHHDVMHDGIERMKVFIERMSVDRPDAIIQLGDFAYPKDDNADIIRMFNQAHEQSLHVIGNHDMDTGLTRKDCIERWGMPARHYVRNIGGLWIIVLDGNDSGSPMYKGGYPSHVGKEQVKWLKEQLGTLDGPIMVACHQPLAGPFAVDNATEIQAILGEVAEKVILVINGHSHIDKVMRVDNVVHMHVNSASYQWVGRTHQHESYPAAIHEAHPWISCTCPYRDCVFATLTIDPGSHSITVEGTRSNWVGKSPAQLGADLEPSLTDGEEIAPRIRDRKITRSTGRASMGS